MMRKAMMPKVVATAAAALMVAGAAHGQLAGLPVVDRALGQIKGAIDMPLQDARDGLSRIQSLAATRLDRLGDFVRGHRGTVDVDDHGEPARAGEVLLLDPDTGALARAGDSGFRVIEQGEVDGLGLAYVRLATPPGLALADALRRLRRAVPDKTVSADQIHFPSGTPGAGGARPGSLAAPTGGTVGIIDGGALPAPRLAAQAGFANGAPRPSAHGQAIASLLGGAGVARVLVADVYGADPAGGNALAIAKALGWMSVRGVPVVSISLVGPANPLLERAIAAAQGKGMIVTAAVGNDGAAAPPAYPASYRGVVAVTGVDGRGRVLFEAGRASHLDYAAPGADISAMGLDGHRQSLRGTSFAAPLAAARLAALRVGVDAATALQRADAEAVERGGRKGRGVLCGPCRQGI